LVGSLYYPIVAVAIWFVHAPVAAILMLAAVLLAAATSAVLAYSLLFVTRRECSYCWTSHVVNWCLLALCAWQFLPGVLSRGV
jgi:uncharacterized membrane protein